MKKAYKKPELKEIELKRRTSLLDSSEISINGEVGFNNSAVNEAMKA